MNREKVLEKFSSKFKTENRMKEFDEEEKVRLKEKQKNLRRFSRLQKEDDELNLYDTKDK